MLADAHLSYVLLFNDIFGHACIKKILGSTVIS